MDSEKKSVPSQSLPDPYETIEIDSDSDNSDDSAQDPPGDDDSNSNSNSIFNTVSETSKTSSNIDKTIDEIAKQELKKISLDVHGTFMADFDPEKSKRELRKMNRRLHTKGSGRMAVYTEKGLLLESQKDLCDCLDKDCPGCFFPCSKCGSGKCGSVCRCNRKYTIEYIEIEGTNKIISCPEGYV